MLRLSNIKKNYRVADMEIPALKGINLSFRKNEFVSILGPSGCGKTTMLNIIGGLDKYSDGDLFIAGRSTKEFGDRDWDIYRNHRIGFIFQSYNLIPHQTILGNVELALTIAGLSKAERVEKAKKALERVGLGEQCYKKPNQLSGGQCQRVAIARALVNEPEILLADEPTGALDTVTSVQIMDLIKEISQEKLVIMVTHNPELAEKYSTRIVKLLDGNVVEDSNPFTEDDEIEEAINYNIYLQRKFDEETSNLEESQLKKYKKNAKENAKMSFSTAFKLSAKNLHSKLKRTIMVVVAGSIGIIGVSTVLSVSRGVHDYIDVMQNDMLSGNPITIEKTAIDYNALMDSSSMQDKREALEKGDWVNINSMVQYLLGNEQTLTSLISNNEFDENYINYVKSMPKEYYSAISLQYGVDIISNVYTDFTSTKKDDALYSGYTSLKGITDIYTELLRQLEDYGQYAEAITSLTSQMSQCIPDNDYINQQYDVLSGNLPQNENDVLIVVDEESRLTDLLLAQLGYFTQDEFFNIIYKALPEEDPRYEPSTYKTRFEYEELLNKDFTWYPNDLVYTENEDSITNSMIKFKYNHRLNKGLVGGIDLNICGIVKPKDGISYGCLKTGFLYTEDFARKAIEINSNSKITNYIKINGDITSTKPDGSPLPYGVTYASDLKYAYLDKNKQIIEKNTPANDLLIGEENTMANMMSSMMGITLPSMKTISLDMIGGSSMPTAIKIFPLSFEQKDYVTDYLDKWNSNEAVTFNDYDYNFKNVEGTVTLKNDGSETRNEIKYTDMVELIINMINTMVNVVTYALVAFTALALVVSTVMVGIITYVSVVERVKEIGVIRSLGGRKKDVSHLFNAETFMIGLASGVFGIIVTGILSLLINVIVRAASNGAIKGMAHLTLTTSVVMILLSVVLTLISGLIPAKSAAKKNPVEALRTE